jgi:hypothetical protein
VFTAAVVEGFLHIFGAVRAISIYFEGGINICCPANAPVRQVLYFRIFDRVTDTHVHWRYPKFHIANDLQYQYKKKILFTQLKSKKISLCQHIFANARLAPLVSRCARPGCSIAGLVTRQLVSLMKMPDSL